VARTFRTAITGRQCLASKKLSLSITKNNNKYLKAIYNKD